jgi:DNA-binding response OmpR family regulator
LAIDLARMMVTKGGEPVLLTPTEFQLLSALIKNAGKVMTRGVLLQSIWDDGGAFIDDNTLSVHISRLREKIEGGCIKTIRGVGYTWEDAP